jgi:glycosyltransferase involved in cell wall biosynthesis
MGEPLEKRAASLGIPENRIFNVLHGCDTEKILPKSISDARTALNQFLNNEIVFGYLGALRPSSAELMFASFRETKKKILSVSKLVLIGNHKLDLSKFIPEDCKNDIITTGWLPYEDMNNYLAACDLLLLPFKKAVATDNVWPSKLNDYLTIGRPIVATRMRSLQPIFDSSQVGILTEDDPQNFSEGCVKLINDEYARVRMGNNARKIAETILSWPTIVKRVEDIYSQCMTG